jgi:hypothetical protein
MKSTSRTTIGLKRATQARLNKARAPGQCYDGFLCQLIELWESAYNQDVNYRFPQGKTKTLKVKDRS